MKGEELVKWGGLKTDLAIESTEKEKNVMKCLLRGGK